MAFGKKSREILALQGQLSEKTAQLDGAESYIDDARRISDEVKTLLESDVAAEEIARRAAELVRYRKQEEHYDKLAEEYTQTHEAELIAQMVAETSQEERESIYARVRETCAGDPTFQQKLARQAQEALWQEGEQLLLLEAKEQQRAHVEQELARQAIYSQHTLKFTLEQSINLAHADLQASYQDNDLLVITNSRAGDLVYSYRSQPGAGPWWNYTRGSVTGTKFSAAMSDTLGMFRLGSIQPHVTADTEATLDTLYADRQLYATFYRDGVLKSDKLQYLHGFYRSVEALTAHQVALFTPIAYQQYKEQQQN